MKKKEVHFLNYPEIQFEIDWDNIPDKAFNKENVDEWYELHDEDKEFKGALEDAFAVINKFQLFKGQSKKQPTKKQKKDSTTKQTSAPKKTTTYRPNDFVILESVGTAINIKTLLTYAVLANGEIELDEDQAVHASDVVEEWIEALSTEDRKAFDEIIKAKGKYQPKLKTTPKKKTAKTRKIGLPEKGEKVLLLSEPVKYCKRYLGFDGKEKTLNSIYLFHKTIAKSITEGRMTKKSLGEKRTKVINTIIDDLVNAINYATSNNKNSVTFQIGDELKSSMQEIVESEVHLPAVNIIKRFIGMQGKHPENASIERLLKAINSAFSLDRITEKHKKRVREIQRILDKHLNDERKGVGVDKITLNGLADSIGFELTNETVPDPVVNGSIQVLPPADKKKDQFEVKVPGVPVNTVLNPLPEMVQPGTPNLPGIENETGSDLFKSSDSLTPPTDTYVLNGDVGKLIGQLAPTRCAITLEGDQGGGKTQFSLQLASAFAEVGKSVAYFSLEMSPESISFIKNIERNVNPGAKSNIYFAEKAPEGIVTVRRAAEKFDVVVIDSWNDLDENTSEFKRIRKDFPGTVFIVIFQRTSGKTIRGGTRPLFDADINLDVVKVDEQFVNNYAVARKNRFQQSGIKFNIAQRKITE